MSPTKVIGDYNAAISIDGTTHYLLIQPGNNSTPYLKINRNVLLGVTGQPVDISTVQTLSNKILNNTNTITVRDGVFTIQDDVDLTKQARFQLSGITTGNTRTYTLPDATSTLADISTTQTFTNKTLTNPVISGGSIDNSTITVDTIAGHTVAGNGTVYGLNIHSGVIQTAGAGSTTLLQQNAVQANQLATNAITLGYTQIVSNVTTTSTTQVQATGLTVAVTIPSGNRRIKITVYSVALSTSGSGLAQCTVWDGAVGSGTQLQEWNSPTGNTQTAGMSLIYVSSSIPAAGSKTYNVGFGSSSAGTASIVAGATFPAYILVEAI